VTAERGDRDLWRRAATEPDCFGEIFDRHAAAVHAYCRARLAISERDGVVGAADLVSVVFLEAWRRRGDVELSQESALPWLLGVARRVLLHRARSVRRHQAALSRLGPLDAGSPSAQGSDGDPAEAVARRLDGERRLAAVLAAFRQLRPAEQEVLTLCVWGGLDYACAAVALGVPVGTVRSRLSRARARLAALTDRADRADRADEADQAERVRLAAPLAARTPPHDPSEEIR
jgi:RNA polymerase sigma-70 factor (ECF subfamily)